MKERGIIFTGPSIPAIGDGRKTQTRRLRGLDTINQEPNAWSLVATGWDPPQKDVTTYWLFAHSRSSATFRVRCPYGVAGDRLWVRETWGLEAKYDDLPGSKVAPDQRVWYLADGRKQSWPGRTRSARFMPCWASRGLVEITKIGAEHLQDISPSDAFAEGCRYHSFPAPIKRWRTATVGVFRERWDSLHAKRGHPWDHNDWVWVIQFKVL